MEFIFSRELTKWISISGVSRKNLIQLLQDEYPEYFSGLDNITLSRWSRGKTIPPLYKQLFIAKTLDVDLVHVILSLDDDCIKFTGKTIKSLEWFNRLFNASTNVISYVKVPETVTCHIGNQTYIEHLRDFGEFHDNISALRNFFNHLYSLEDDVKYKCIKLVNEKDKIVGHWTGIEDLSLLKEIPYFSFIEHHDLSECALVNVGHTYNASHMFEIVQAAMCYHLMSKKSQKMKYIYLFIAGFGMFEIINYIFGVDAIKFFPSKDKFNKVGVYVVKINILSAISNPLFLSRVKEKMACITTCDFSKCNLCNLITFCKDEELEI